jgi:hypothetical protein
LSSMHQPDQSPVVRLTNSGCISPDWPWVYFSQVVPHNSVCRLLDHFMPKGHRPWHQADPSHCLHTFHLHTVITKRGLAPNPPGTGTSLSTSRCHHAVCLQLTRNFDGWRGIQCHLEPALCLLCMQMLPMLLRRLLQQLPTLNQIWRLWLVSQQATACTALTAAFVRTQHCRKGLGCGQVQGLRPGWGQCM